MTQNFIENSSLAFLLTILFLPMAFHYVKHFLPNAIANIAADCCAVYPQLTAHFAKLNPILSHAQGLLWECQRAARFQTGVPLSFKVFACLTISLVQGLLWWHWPLSLQYSVWLVAVSLLLCLLAYVDWLFHLVSPNLCKALWALVLLGVSMGFVPISIEDSLYSSFIGGACFYGIFYLSFRLYGREVFGRGDVYFMFAISGLFHWQTLPKLVLIASLSGVAFALLCWACTKFLQQFQPTQNALTLSHFTLPFVPFLAFATVVCDYLQTAGLEFS